MSEKICVPQAAVAGIDLGGRRYHARNGVMTVDNPAHAREMRKHLECFDSYAPIPNAAGFVCESCGFHAYFRTCGRCGGVCRREGDHDGQVTE